MLGFTEIAVSVMLVLAIVFSVVPVVTVENDVPTFEAYEVESPQPEIPEGLREYLDEYGIDLDFQYIEPGELPEGFVLFNPDSLEATVEKTDETQETVVGTWHNAANGYVISFLENGTCGNDHGFSGTYTVEDDVLTIVEDTGYTQRFRFSINGDTMTLEDVDTGEGITVTRQ